MVFITDKGSVLSQARTELLYIIYKFIRHRTAETTVFKCRLWIWA